MHTSYCYLITVQGNTTHQAKLRHWQIVLHAKEEWTDFGKKFIPAMLFPEILCEFCVLAGRDVPQDFADGGAQHPTV